MSYFRTANDWPSYGHTHLTGPWARFGQYACHETAVWSIIRLIVLEEMDDQWIMVKGDWNRKCT